MVDEVVWLQLLLPSFLSCPCPHLLVVVEVVVALADGGAVEGVSLKDVGTRLQESRVDLLNYLRRRTGSCK